ncbi:MAG: crotonase/enoyl-CoA hydratase family protein [Gammaproteobacteria bacterium]|nr:MAG: crotonase/enoyl-CoA hydratase family protein [Gammaproteobacteria bacterium]
MADQRVTIDVDDHVARVRLCRADKRNALDLAMFQGLADAADTLAVHEDLRAVLIEGEGKSFCAGLDVGAFLADPATAEKLLVKASGEATNLAQRVCWAWRRLPVPVIAALHGEVFGGGLQIALGADIRIVSPDARLSIMEIRWGLVPDMAGTRVLRDIVSYDVAMDLALTGRIVNGDEALRMGLATRVAADPVKTAADLAREIAARSPDAVRATKHLLHNAWRVDDRSGLDMETRLQMDLLGGRNQMEAARAGMERREPSFRPATVGFPQHDEQE